MTRVSISKARQELAELTNRVAYAKERFVLERNGKPVAAVVSVDDLEALERLEDALDLAAARRALRERGSLDYRAVRRKLGLSR
jgi:prevent-host-death family protein